MHIVKELLENVSTLKLNRFLNEHKITNEQKAQFPDQRVMLETFVLEGIISIEDLNHFFYDELLYGQHRLMRVYFLSAKTCSDLTRKETWTQFLKKFGIADVDYNQIVETIPMRTESLKVAKMQEERVAGFLVKINIVFVFSMLKMTTQSVETECSYIPVTIDLRERCLIIKVWNQNGTTPDSRPTAQLDLVYNTLKESLEVENEKERDVDPQNVLYDMSKELFNIFFERLPNIQEINGKRQQLGEVIDILLRNIPLKHVKQKDGQLYMPEGIIDLEEELYKLIQQTALYDYREDYTLESLLPQEEKYVSKIRFSDRDNLSANLMGENGVECIYDTKTFMCIRDSLDIVQRIISLNVNFPRTRGMLQVKYEADNYQYMTVHILDGKYYTEAEFKEIWELYKEYERKRCYQTMHDNATTTVTKAV